MKCDTFPCGLYMSAWCFLRIGLRCSFNGLACMVGSV